MISKGRYCTNTLEGLLTKGRADEWQVWKYRELLKRKEHLFSNIKRTSIDEVIIVAILQIDAKWFQLWEGIVLNLKPGQHNSTYNSINSIALDIKIFHVNVCGQRFTCQNVLQNGNRDSGFSHFSLFLYLHMECIPAVDMRKHLLSCLNTLPLDITYLLLTVRYHNVITGLMFAKSE